MSHLDLNLPPYAWAVSPAILTRGMIVSTILTDGTLPDEDDTAWWRVVNVERIAQDDAWRVSFVTTMHTRGTPFVETFHYGDVLAAHHHAEWFDNDDDEDGDDD